MSYETTLNIQMKKSGRDIGQFAALASALQGLGTASGALEGRVEEGGEGGGAIKAMV